MSGSKLAMTRTLAAIAALLTLGGCTSGINAGVDGGVAFIALAGMLVLMVIILWFILGRED